MLHRALGSYSYLIDLLKLLTPRNRRHLLLVGFVQFSLSLLDLMGLVVIGVVTSLGYSAINSTDIPNSLNFIWNIPILKDQGLEYITFLFALLAVVLLLLKTLLSALLVRKAIGFLAVREAEISSYFVRRMLNSNPSELRKRSPQQVSGVALAAVNAGITVTLGQLTTLVVEVLSIVLVITGMSFVDFTVTIPTLIFFILLGYITIRVLKERVARSTAESYFLGISSAELIRNALATSRDIYLSNMQNQIADEYSKLRHQNYKATRSAAFASSLPKFISEVGLIAGGSLIALTQIVLKDARGVLIGLVLFLALSSRIIPSILRVQNAILEINGARGASLDLLGELTALAEREFNYSFEPDIKNQEQIKNFCAEMEIVDGSFTHDPNGLFNLRGISLRILPGEFIGIAGPSGGGKTTLLDILAGIIELDEGKVIVSGLSPRAAVLVWPNEIRYVPQDVHLIAGTLRMNICWPNLESTISDSEIWKILENVGLLTWVESLPNGIDARVETFGSNISGGQKQRIGIARALCAKPQILMFDEATSSLDTSTEQLIANNVMANLSGVTRVVVAHRLSTIINADRIYYISNGQILASGNFDDIRGQVPEFDRQAIINGL
jgi:ABC-type multidrug transport system fused ATPase/permease subunit